MWRWLRQHSDSCTHPTGCDPGFRFYFSNNCLSANGTVIYDGGSLPGLKSGAKMKMYIESSGNRLMDDKGKTLG
jgi:hypothetical protein